MHRPSLRATGRFLARHRPIWLSLVLAAILTVLPRTTGVVAQTDDGPPSPLLVDNFEAYETGGFTSDWVYVGRSGNVIPPEEAMEPGDEVFVRKENGNKFARYITRNEAIRFSQRNGKEFDWSLKEHPFLSWRWRAIRLPEGASEKGKNDTGGAVYVTFGTDWLGRPKSIKYTYSSSLPVGTVVEFGPLYVIVAASAAEGKTGTWRTERRRIADDYRQVFGGSPPDRPLSITLWSDSDTTRDTAIVDFDDIRLLPRTSGGASSRPRAEDAEDDGSR
jgi:hypothetical protein